AVEGLADRIAPSVSSIFNPLAHSLTVNSDGASDTINVSNDGAGVILVNGVAVDPVNVTLANVTLGRANGNGGHDDIRLASLNTLAFGTQTLIDGGAGNDELTGSIGNDSLTGGAGIDLIDGQNGNDRLVEQGDFNYTLTAGNLTTFIGLAIETD